MIRSRLSRVLSLAVASLSFGTHMVVHVQTGAATERYEVAESCFTGTDYPNISVSDLSVLVERYVGTMRGLGASDNKIVETLGYQLGKEAQGCSKSQVKGLMNNVGLILVDLGFDSKGKKIASVLARNFSRYPGAVVTDDDVVTGEDKVY